MKVYLVGGAVRDALLNLPVREKDYVVIGATVDEMLAKGFQPVGKAFPVFLHPKTKEEYALARTEKKVSKGYHGFIFHAEPNVTLEEDLIRRDLTINAMAQDDNGNIIDPYYGKQDLENKLLRHVSDAFAEDPVRILRLARFAARFAHLGFTVAPQTLELMRTMVKNGEVDALVPERVWKEMQTALCEPAPEVFFEILKSCGALEKLFPNLHDWSVLKHATQLSDDPIIRFAALPFEACKHLRVPNEYQDLAKLVDRYHQQTQQILNAEQMVTLLENLDVFRRPDRLEPFLIACQAYDSASQTDSIRAAFSAVSTIDIATIAQGLQGVAIKKAIHEARVAKLC